MDPSFFNYLVGLLGLYLAWEHSVWVFLLIGIDAIYFLLLSE